MTAAKGVRARLLPSRALHKIQKLRRSVTVSCTPEIAAAQPTQLDAGVVSPEQQIQILRRKHFIARQVIEILAAENSQLKIALGRRAAA